jgi:hypothetical protein
VWLGADSQAQVTEDFLTTQKFHHSGFQLSLFHLLKNKPYWAIQPGQNVIKLFTFIHYECS